MRSQTPPFFWGPPHSQRCRRSERSSAIRHGQAVAGLSATTLSTHGYASDLNPEAHRGRPAIALLFENFHHRLRSSLGPSRPSTGLGAGSQRRDGRSIRDPLDGVEKTLYREPIDL